MEKNMQENFNLLEKRVLDSLEKSDLEYIRYKLTNLNNHTVVSGVGGSSVVSEMAAKILELKNNIITKNAEPRDFVYNKFNGFTNVLACSYSGNNYGVFNSFNNNKNHYLLSNNEYDDTTITFLKYITSIDKEKSFISLGATLIPIAILMNYYLDGKDSFTQNIIKEREKYNFDINVDAYEIFSGIDTSVTSKYIESTMTESGIAIPVVHDKYSFCHGRSTLSINNTNTAIYLFRDTELDKLLIEELKIYYKEIIIIDSVFKDQILADYEMLVKAMYLTKYIAEQKGKDLSGVDYSPIVKKLYKYNKQI